MNDKMIWRFAVVAIVWASLGLGMVQAQTVWLETGLGYREDSASDYKSNVKFGVKGFIHLPDNISIYTGVSVQKQMVIDAGLWYAFAPKFKDIFGVRTYGGFGLSYVGKSNFAAKTDDESGTTVDTSRPAAFGFALSVAAEYDISNSLGVALTYTHRPLIIPEFSQSFDISLGLTVDLDKLLGL